VKIAIQCDFDGTITEGEISHLILNRFAEGDWKEIVKEFDNCRITVMECMKRCFALIKADEPTIVDYVLKSERLKIRPGFKELYEYCLNRDFNFAVVSNGLVFYIKAILDSIGVKGIEINAARGRCSPAGMSVIFPGSDGKVSAIDFKEIYTRRMENKGYKVICLGDSISDKYVARRAYKVFAIGELGDFCRKENIAFTPFETFFDIKPGLEAIK
jgi:2-hydroxy-3-keto-5-methylthiopentenyl-1-phosphate phosphatase